MPTATADGYLGALRQLPLTSPVQLLAGRPLVVVAPHPDDESLGLGGLIAAARALGTAVTAVFLTDGEASHMGSPTCTADQLALLRRQEAMAALGVLGVPPASAHFLSLGDSQLPRLSPGVRSAAMESLLALVPGGALVCVTSQTDPHGDHQAASALVRETPWGSQVTVMEYPVWTWCAATRDLPNQMPEGFRIDVSAYVAQKKSAVALHRSQHGGVILDATEAFELDPEFVDALVGPTETLTWPG